MPNDDFLNGVDDVDQEHLDELKAQYPIIQWINGKPKNKKSADASYEGGWFIPDKYVPEGGMGDGWVRHELIHDNGTTWGWATYQLTVALIRNRRKWTYTDKDDQVISVPWNEYRKYSGDHKLNGRTHTLVAIKGYEVPFVLTSSGNSSKSLDQCCMLFQRNVIIPANELVKDKGKRWPFRAFWMTIGPKKTEKGEPLFSEVGKREKSTITLIYCDVTDKPETKEQLGARFVGRELLQQFETWYTDAETWAHEWDKAQASEEDDHSTNGDGEAAAEPEPALNF